MTSPILTWVVMQEQGNPDQNSEYRRMWFNKIIGIHFWCSRRGVSPLQPEHAWRVFGVVFWAWIKHGSKFRTPKLRNCRVCQISINFPVLRFFPRCLFTLGNFAGHVYQGVCWWSFGVQLEPWDHSPVQAGIWGCYGPKRMVKYVHLVNSTPKSPKHPFCWSIHHEIHPIIYSRLQNLQWVFCFHGLLVSKNYPSISS